MDNKKIDHQHQQPNKNKRPIASGSFASSSSVNSFLPLEEAGGQQYNTGLGSKKLPQTKKGIGGKTGGSHAVSSSPRKHQRNNQEMRLFKDDIEVNPVEKQQPSNKSMISSPIKAIPSSSNLIKQTFIGPPSGKPSPMGTIDGNYQSITNQSSQLKQLEGYIIKPSSSKNLKQLLIATASVYSSNKNSESPRRFSAQTQVKQQQLSAAGAVGGKKTKNKKTSKQLREALLRNSQNHIQYEQLERQQQQELAQFEHKIKERQRAGTTLGMFDEDRIVGWPQTLPPSTKASDNKNLLLLGPKHSHFYHGHSVKGDQNQQVAVDDHHDPVNIANVSDSDESLKLPQLPNWRLSSVKSQAKLFQSFMPAMHSRNNGSTGVLKTTALTNLNPVMKSTKNFSLPPLKKQQYGFMLDSTATGTNKMTENKLANISGLRSPNLEEEPYGFSHFKQASNIVAQAAAAAAGISGIKLRPLYYQQSKKLKQNARSIKNHSIDDAKTKPMISATILSQQQHERRRTQQPDQNLQPHSQQQSTLATTPVGTLVRTMIHELGPSDHGSSQNLNTIGSKRSLAAGVATINTPKDQYMTMMAPYQSPSNSKTQQLFKSKPSLRKGDIDPATGAFPQEYSYIEEKKDEESEHENLMSSPIQQQMKYHHHLRSDEKTTTADTRQLLESPTPSKQLIKTRPRLQTSMGLQGGTTTATTTQREPPQFQQPVSSLVNNSQILIDNNININEAHENINQESTSLDIGAYRTALLLSKICQRRQIKVNVPDTILISMNNANNQEVWHSSSQNQLLSSQPMNREKDFEIVLTSWLNKNMAKSQQGSYVPIAYSKLDLLSTSPPPELNHSKDRFMPQQIQWQSQLDFFVVTARSHLEQVLKQCPYRSTGYLLQRYIPQRGQCSQVYRVQWHSEKGFKFYLYSCRFTYNGQVTSSSQQIGASERHYLRGKKFVSFEKLARLYKEVSHMDQTQIQQALQTNSLIHTDKEALKSQQHVLLQNELYSRFPNLSDQYKVNIPSESGAILRTDSNDDAIKQKIKPDTHRFDIPNAGTYRLVLANITKQMSEIIQSLQESQDLLHQMFGANGTLKKITADFLEDYQSEIDKPAIMLTKIVQIEVYPIQEQQPPIANKNIAQYEATGKLQNLPSSQNTKQFRCQGDYCYIQREPFIPTHLAPILTDILLSRTEHPQISLKTIQQERQQLTILKQQQNQDSIFQNIQPPQLPDRSHFENLEHFTTISALNNNIQMTHSQLLIDDNQTLGGHSRERQRLPENGQILNLSQLQPILTPTVQDTALPGELAESKLLAFPQLNSQSQTGGNNSQIRNSPGDQFVEVCTICYKVYSYLQQIHGQSQERQCQGITNQNQNFITIQDNREDEQIAQDQPPSTLMLSPEDAQKNDEHIGGGSHFISLKSRNGDPFGPSNPAEEYCGANQQELQPDNNQQEVLPSIRLLQQELLLAEADNLTEQGEKVCGNFLDVENLPNKDDFNNDKKIRSMTAAHNIPLISTNVPPLDEDSPTNLRVKNPFVKEMKKSCIIQTFELQDILPLKKVQLIPKGDLDEPSPAILPIWERENHMTIQSSSPEINKGSPAYSNIDERKRVMKALLSDRTDKPNTSQAAVLPLKSQKTQKITIPRPLARSNDSQRQLINANGKQNILAQVDQLTAKSVGLSQNFLGTPMNQSLTKSIVIPLGASSPDQNQFSNMSHISLLPLDEVVLPRSPQVRDLHKNGKQTIKLYMVRKSNEQKDSLAADAQSQLCCGQSYSSQGGGNMNIIQGSGSAGMGSLSNSAKKVLGKVFAYQQAMPQQSLQQRLVGVVSTPVNQGSQSLGASIVIGGSQTRTDNSKKVDSFFGRLSQQEEEYLVEYIASINDESSVLYGGGTTSNKSSQETPFHSSKKEGIVVFLNNKQQNSTLIQSGDANAQEHIITKVIPPTSIVVGGQLAPVIAPSQDGADVHIERVDVRTGNQYDQREQRQATQKVHQAEIMKKGNTQQEDQ